VPLARREPHAEVLERPSTRSGKAGRRPRGEVFAVVDVVVVVGPVGAGEEADLVGERPLSQLAVDLDAEVAVGRRLVGRARSTKRVSLADCSRSRPTGGDLPAFTRKPLVKRAST
jgi:hypothetical protein